MTVPTKKIISNSIIHLLEKTSYESLTVSMIMKEAGMSRQTFYHYFQDIPSAMFSIFSEDLEKSFALFKQGKSYRDSTEYLLNNLKEKKNFLRVLVTEFDNKFFVENYYDLLMDVSYDYIGLAQIDDEIEFLLSLYWFGVIYKMIGWIKSGMSLEVERLVELLYAGMPSRLQTYMSF